MDEKEERKVNERQKDYKQTEILLGKTREEIAAEERAHQE